MKKVLKPLMIAALAIPTLSFAASETTTVDKVKQAIGPTTAPVQVDASGQVTVESPRTGIRYTFANPNRPIVLQTAAITAANAANADRIVASNPALSATSQQQAKQALLNEAAQLAKKLSFAELNKTSHYDWFFIVKNHKKSEHLSGFGSIFCLRSTKLYFSKTSILDILKWQLVTYLCHRCMW
ncbi:hypothetical protein HADU_05550 [Acinetobacter sp. HA]|nr:hypothetical protein HADU_05550 [Acinetobacter sp. HA]